MTGDGVLIGDVDSIADIYHPTYFKGDAGYYDWIDVNGDGVLTPGVDAIDLNRNGQVDPGETIREVVRAETWCPTWEAPSTPARRTSTLQSTGFTSTRTATARRDYGSGVL